MQPRLRPIASAAFVITLLGGCPEGANVPAPAVLDDPAPPAVVRPAWGQPRTPGHHALAERLHQAELGRRANDPAIAEALASPDADAFTDGVWALARIGGTQAAARLLSVVGGLGPSMEDRSEVLSALALLEPPAHAVGEPPEPSGIWRDLEDALWTRYAVTERDDEARALLLAIARVGGKRSAARLAVDLSAVPPVGSGGRFVAGTEAVGVLCARGHGLTADGLNALADGLTATDTVVRDGSSYALGRCAGPSAELLAGPKRGVLVQRLQPAVESTSNSEGARLAWKALAALGEIPDPVPESILTDASVPWQLEVQAVRALGETAKGREILAERLAARDPGSLSGTRMHAVLEALRALRPSIDGTPELLDPLKSLTDALDQAYDRVPEPHRRGISLARCELRLLEAIASASLGALLACPDPDGLLPDAFAETLAVEALVHSSAGTDGKRKARADGLLARAEDGRAPVAVRAISGLTELDDERANAVLRVALERKDFGVVAAAAGAITRRAADSNRRDPDAVDNLAQAIGELANGEAVESRIAAIEALGALARGSKGSDAAAPPWLEAHVLPLAGDANVAVRRAARQALLGHVGLLERFDSRVADGSPDAAAAPALEAHAASGLPGARGLRIHTGVGTIDVEFAGVPAPVAQASLAALAQRGYFNGLRWHRVVPDFVIQGGDPRGDGYGGPGYLMPCEWSNLRYERGTVGIALAGKDTGGSQIFITHSRQPHLDARYTIVGQVSEGLDVLDAVFAQETIERIEVLRGEP